MGRGEQFAEYPKFRSPYPRFGYSGLNFLENDMLFIKETENLYPEAYDPNKSTGVYSNKWLLSGGQYGNLETFERGFNKWLGSLLTGWYPHTVHVDFDWNEPFTRVLSFAGVDERLSRHNDISATSGAYSSMERGGDEMRELTYRYKFDSNFLTEYLKGVATTEIWAGIPTENNEGYSDWVDDNINKLNSAKFLRWQLNRYLEMKKQDIWTKYAGTTLDFVSTEFDDLQNANENYGCLFFTEHGRNVTDLASRFDETKGDYDEGVYDNAEYDDPNVNEKTSKYDESIYDVDVYDSQRLDRPDLFPADSHENDPLGSEFTSLWFAPFDVSEISMSDYNGEELVEITIAIPEGVAYNNEAKIINLSTKGQTSGAVCELNNTKREFKTYQIDGLFHNGIPQEQIAKMTIEQVGNFKRVASNKILTIIGTDTWFDKQKVIDNIPQDPQTLGKNDVPFMVSDNLKYQLLHPKSGDNGRFYILPSVFSQKTHQNKIGSLNRVKYRGNRFRVRNSVATNALGYSVIRYIQPDPINRPLQWFPINGGYDNTGPYSNVILGGSPDSSGFGGIPLDTAHANGVGFGAGFQVDNNVLTVRLNLVGYATNEAGQYVPDSNYVHYGGEYLYKVRLEWRQNGTYNTFFDEIVFRHDASQDWDLCYKGSWLRTAQASRFDKGGLTVPQNADRIRITIYGEDATQVNAVEYDATPYKPPVPIEEKIPLNIKMSDYDIKLGVVAREIRHI